MRSIARRFLAPATGLVLALGLGLGLSACDAPTPTEQPSPAPSESSELLGGLLGLGKPSGYTLVRDPLLPGLLKSITTTGIIGLEGGTITLLGHSLIVPPGAVQQPTLFTLLVLPTGYVEVELGATLQTLLGTVLDVGGKGFAKPVPVTLSYQRATNVKDPRKLTILRVNSLIGYGKYEVMPSRVDLERKTVTADLDHFSRYVLSYP